MEKNFGKSISRKKFKIREINYFLYLQAQITSSAAALGASFIQEKPNNENSSPAKQQRPGPNASRMLQLQNATSIVGRCEYLIFVLYFYLGIYIYDNHHCNF